MTFEMTHLFLNGASSTFSANNPPSWLTSSEYGWWWKRHVLTLDVDESIKSDFQKIKRLS